MNPEMVERLETAGLQFVGKDETGRRMEVRFHFAVALCAELTIVPLKITSVSCQLL